MFEGKDEEQRELNRRQLNAAGKDDMAWLGLKGNVPQREKEIGGGMVGGLQKNPMLWAMIVLLAGFALYLLVTLVLV